MAVGDTITGTIRVVREEASGSQPVVVGDLASSQIDHKDDSSKALFVNPNPLAPPPQNVGQVMVFPDAVFDENEVIIVQHKSASLTEAADYDADEIFIGIIDLDKARGTKTPKLLTVAVTEVAADPTTSTSSYVSLFKETVPAGHMYFISGQFNVAAVEVA